MKPNFALKLSNDGIELLHRSSGGWLTVGSLNFTDDDVARGCADLLAEAARLEPGGIRTKLVLPDSETRYTSVVAPGPTDEARRYQIEAEIEALTPYSVDELAYDWSVEGDYALVVVCAKETLAEAENFADGYGFNPVSFVAAPESGQFNGEPFFGQTSVAARHLPAGDTVQRDVEPVRVTGVVPEAQSGSGEKPAKPAAEHRPVQAKAEAQNPSTPTRNAAEPGAASATGKMPDPKISGASATAARKAAVPVARPDPVKPTSTPQNQPSRPPATRAEGAEAPPARRVVPALPAMPSEPLAKVGGLVRRMGTRLRREQARMQAGIKSGEASKTARNLDDAAEIPVPPEGMSASPLTRSQKPADGATAKTGGAPALSGGGQVGSLARLGVVAGSESAGEQGDAGNKSGDGAPVSFSSRRATAPSIASSTEIAPSTASGPGGRIAVVSGTAGRERSVEAGFLQALLERGRGLANRIKPATGQNEPEEILSKQRRKATGPEPIVPASRPPASERDKQTEAEALTIFGARGNQAQRGLVDNRALLAGGAGLLLVVAVAVWMLYFRGADDATQLAGLADDNAGQVQTPQEDPIQAPAALSAPDERGLQQAALDASRPVDEQVTPQPVAPDNAAPTEQPAVDAPVENDGAPQQVSRDDAPLDGGPAATDPQRLVEALVDEALNQTQPADDTVVAEVGGQTDDAVPAAGQDAATQVATRAGGGEATDTPQVANTGTALRRLSLPSGFDVPPMRETAFNTPTPPPPPGAEFTFDDRGLVEATPEGALTPLGVMVYARRPDLVPAPRPLSAIPRDVLPPDFPRADPALADARPQPRSDAIAEAVRAFRESQGLTPEAPLTPAPVDVQQDASLQPTAPVEAPGAESEETTRAAQVAPETPPPGGVSLAALRPDSSDTRPQQRPTDLVPPAALAGPQQTDAGAVEAGEAPAIALEGATDEAVAASLQPRDRPADVAERARAALAEATARQEEREERQAEVRAAQPEIPTAASVARQATETDAIRLNQINLIGVFGTPEDRRALVRLSSGRVVRVQVGDRLDGGRVTAIGAGELRYTKNGRNELLEIDG